MAGGEVDWYQRGEAAYEDGQPLHAAPSAEPFKSQWLEGWNAAHARAQVGQHGLDVIQGRPVLLKQIGERIYLVDHNGDVIGDQKYIELEADAASLKWTARVTFTDLRLQSDSDPTP